MSLSAILHNFSIVLSNKICFYVFQEFNSDFNSMNNETILTWFSPWVGSYVVR